MGTLEKIGVKKIEKQKLREEFLYHILQWDPKWFAEENTSTIKINSIIPSKLKPTSLIYNNYNDYFQTHFLFLIHDFWYQLEDIRENGDKCEKPSTIELSKTSLPLRCISVNSRDNKVCRIKMRTVLPYNLNIFYACRGSLVKFQNPLNKNVEEFAFVDSILRDNLQGLGKYQLTYDLIIKYRENMEIPDVINLETVTVVLSVYMNLIDSLINLSKSPLCKTILKPNFKDYEFSSIDNSDIIPPVIKDKLNSKQMDIMSRIVKLVEEKKAGIFMVSGPAGTGKTKTIVHSILSIISRKSTDKILVCAQSNLAIDSIVLQLLKAKPKLIKKGIWLNIIRLGQEEKMNERVKLISFKRRQQRLRGENGSTLLRRANIIAGTLTCCPNLYIKPFFKDIQIPVCIVDDAPQASEIETCIPLLLGVKTMILVGDPHQFSPKIYSDEVKNQNLEQSLFLRAQKIFEKDENNPILTLNTQYRMNEAIAKWPNKYFYKGALKNSVSIRPLGICNYRVLNHSSPEEDGKYVNLGEAKLVVNIAYTLMTHMNLKTLNNPLHIGIIAFSDLQQELIIDMLDKRTSYICKERRDKIELSVVKMTEAFQGSQCDIIILSCVRSTDSKLIDDPNKLCVSLTRAKHTLIICGNFIEYKQNEMWDDLIKDSRKRNVFFTIDHNDKPSLLKQYLIIHS